MLDLLFYTRNNCISDDLIKIVLPICFNQLKQHVFERTMMRVVKYFSESSVVSLFHLTLVQP